jgi:multiple sugar transport system substrate-binding protein
MSADKEEDMRARRAAVAVVLAGVVAGCAAPATSPRTSSNAASTSPVGSAAGPIGGQDPITVAIMSGPEGDNITKLAADYQAKTGNLVTVDKIARDGYQEKVRVTVVGGGNDYDVVYLGGDWIPGLVAADGLEPLANYLTDPQYQTSYFRESDVRAAMDVLQVEGADYVLPTDGDAAWLWYRKDLLNAAGLKPPTTMAELLDDAKRLTTTDHYGLVIGALRSEIQYDFIHYFFAFGGQFYDPSTYEVTVNNPAGVAALTYYAGLLKEGVVSPDVTQNGYDGVLTALQQEKAAMGVEWMAATDTLTSCDQSPKVCKTIKYQLVPQNDPNNPGYGGSQSGWAIPRASGHKSSAFRFIQWVVGQDGARQWALNGGIPSNVAVLSDPAITEQKPQFDLLAQVLPHRHILPINRASTEIVNAFVDAASSAVAGADPKAALDKAASKMTDELRKAGYLK